MTKKATPAKPDESKVIVDMEKEPILTGWYPALDSKGKPKTASLTDDQYTPLFELRMRSTRAGSLTTFVDDLQGKRGPRPLRGHLLRKMARMISVNGVEVPAFYVDEDVKNVPGTAARPAVMDAKIKAAQEFCKEQQSELRAQAQATVRGHANANSRS